MRYYDMNIGTELLVGVHIVEGEVIPPHVLPLDESHEFFQIGSLDPDGNSPNGYKFEVQGGELVKVAIVFTPTEEVERATVLEAAWVREQLAIASEEMELCADLDPMAQGRISDWTEYRKELRAWKDHPSFPNINFRPSVLLTDHFNNIIDPRVGVLWYV